MRNTIGLKILGIVALLSLIAGAVALIVFALSWVVGLVY